MTCFLAECRSYRSPEFKIPDRFIPDPMKSDRSAVSTASTIDAIAPSGHDKIIAERILHDPGLLPDDILLSIG